MLIGVNHSARLRSLSRFWISVVALTLCACAPDMSGAYIARDETDILMLQVVAGADNQLSGTLHHVSLDANGQAKTFTASVTGVMSGGDIALTIRPNGMLTTTTSLSATHKPGVITVTWVGSDQVSTSVLHRRGISEFTRYAEELQQRGSAIRGERAEQRRQDQARRTAEQRRAAMAALAADLERAGARHAESLTRVARSENRFKDATARMNQWVSQWRTASEQSGARGDLSYRIRTMDWDMNTLESDMRTARRTSLHRLDAGGADLSRALRPPPRGLGASG